MSARAFSGRISTIPFSSARYQTCDLSILCRPIRGAGSHSADVLGHWPGPGWSDPMPQL